MQRVEYLLWVLKVLGLISTIALVIGLVIKNRMIMLLGVAMVLFTISLCYLLGFKLF